MNAVQFRVIIHSVPRPIVQPQAVLFVAAMIAHIYIGTIGMEGAFEAMGSGTVDVNWAKEHHSLWLEQQRAREAEGNTRSAAAAPAE